MKFHAIALVLLVAGAARAQDYPNRSHRTHTEGMRSQTMTETRVELDRYTGQSLHAGGPLFHRDILFPELTDVREVASKVSTIVENQRKEVAALRAVAPRATTAGYTNIASVYSYMAEDHSRLADFGANWLRDRDFAVPPEPAVVPAADMAPVESVDHHLHMHLESYNRALDQRRTEPSSTVRTMLLWSAATAARHISLLRTLDSDLDRGRKSMSARLQSQMDTTLVASSQSDILARIMREDEEYFASLAVTTPAVAAAPVVIEKEVIVEKIVEKPVIVEKIVEKPVVTERIVERKVFVTRPQVRSQVAGRRQATGARRVRRPAK